MPGIHQQSDENKNKGIRKKVDTDTNPMMLLPFLIDIWKVIKKGLHFTKKIDFFTESPLYGSL